MLLTDRRVIISRQLLLLLLLWSFRERIPRAAAVSELAGHDVMLRCLVRRSSLSYLPSVAAAFYSLQFGTLYTQQTRTPCVHVCALRRRSTGCFLAVSLATKYSDHIRDFRQTESMSSSMNRATYIPPTSFILAERKRLYVHRFVIWAFSYLLLDFLFLSFPNTNPFSSVTCSRPAILYRAPSIEECIVNLC